MSEVKEVRFRSEEEALACARSNNGIHYREDWKTLPDNQKDKPWVAKYGPGIEPVPVSYAFPTDSNAAAMATLMATVAQLQATVAALTEAKVKKSESKA